MKSTMKKIAASLLALLMMIQLVPAFAATYSSGIIAGTAAGYKDLLEIVASKGTYVLLGQTLMLDANEDYAPTWSSSNERVATISGWGEVTAVSAGTATITATVKEPQLQTASIEITVIDPEPILAEAPETENSEEETPEEGTSEEGTPEEGQEPDEQGPAAPEKKTLVVVINGENEHLTYDGEEHLLDRFVATGNEDFFDETRVKAEGDLGVTGTDCGIYELNLEGIRFTYDDPDVEAHFVINNSFLKITPAQVTVTANEVSKNEGENDPELTATVVGLFGEDTVDYTLSREPGEEVGEYVIAAAGAEMQGNYRINFVPGKFEIEGEPVVDIESSLLPGQLVFQGTEVTLKARPAGFGDAQLTYQWQYSTDGENWTDIGGANDAVYMYIVDESNALYYYRVMVDTID